MIADSIITALRSALGDGNFPLHEPRFADKEQRPAWRLMHRLAPYQECPRAPLPVAESLERRIVNLPSSAGLV